MSRLHTDAVEVVRRDDEPVEFTWRGRAYVVHEVLSRWTESGAWWRSAAVTAVSDGGSAALRTAPIPSSPKWAQRAWGEPAPDVPAAVGPALIDDGECDWFRVEAGSTARGASSGGTGVYDLCLAGTSGGWTLSRVLD